MQERDKLPPEYLADHWDTADGLPGNSIVAIAQTPDGYLWFATTKGLTRFDGLKFSVVDFLENEDKTSQEILPDALFVDRKGILWIGSSTGLTQYDYKTRQFKTLTAQDGITADRIRVIDEDIKGNLWISFDVSYLNRFTNGRFTAFNVSHGLEDKKTNAIVEDAGGNLLFGTRENGVYILRGERFSKYEIAGLGKGYLIITMYEDRDNDLWIGTNKGLFRVTAKDDKIYVYTTRDGLAGDYIISILEDENRNLWVGTANGLSRWGKKQSDAAVFSRIDQMKNHVITYLFKDRENSLWVGTYEAGIWQIKAARFSSCTIQEKGQEEIIFSLFEDRLGNTWIGTLSGRLYCCNNCTVVKTLEIPGISGTGISAIAEDDRGNLWLGTNGKGVFMGKAGRFANFTMRDGLADNMVISIFKDSNESLWFAAAGGVSRYNGSTRRLESFKTDEGLPRKVHNVYEDKNHDILLATDKGIMIIKNSEFINNKMTGSCRDLPVTCIVRDHNGNSPFSVESDVYWIATHGSGLKRFKNGTLTSYTTKEGMASNFIYQVFEDGLGNLWMMSDNGVLRASKNELNGLADGRVRYINCTAFGISDGMKSIEFNNMFSRHSALQIKTGELRFITRKDIAVVKPGEIEINKTPPAVVIEAALLNDHAVPNECYGQDGKENVFKTVEDMVFLFTFTAPTFLSPEKVTFKYKLEGFDRDWVFLGPGKRRAAYYQNLAPGTYSFSVTACNSDGVWNETGGSFAFTLKPPVYDTMIFKLGVLVLITGLGWVGYFLYKRLKPLFLKPGDSKRTEMNPLFAEECIKKLSYLMETEKLYREESISLQSLAEKLSIPPRLLSQLLNEKLNCTFPDYINNYRIEEAKELLVDPTWADRKVISIAFEVGYNTKAAFYGVFKRYTGMTPIEYRKTRNPKSEIARTNKSK